MSVDVDADSTALQLVDTIYQAAVEPAHWYEFACELSDAFDGAPVTVGMGIAGSPAEQHYFTAGLPNEFGRSLLPHYLEDNSMDPSTFSAFTDQFQTVNAAFPDLVLETSDLYRDWMEPRGLAPVWPLAHIMALRGSKASAVLVVFRKRGGEAFGPEEIELGNKLVPHLSRAFEIYESLSGIHRDRRSLDEVIDRLRVGVIMTDVHNRPVLMNRSAQSLIERGEIIGLDGGRVRARIESDDGLLQSAMKRAATDSSWSAIRLGELGEDGDTLQVLVNPLTAAPPGSQAHDAATALFLAGRETSAGVPLRHLQDLHGLTTAEAELVARLARGASLEKAASDRGISLNTARSQLKQAFAKTGTRRQGELVQLVLTGLSSVNES